MKKYFSSHICDLYTEYIHSGINSNEYCAYVCHILRFLAPIKPDLLQNYLPRIGEFIDDERPILQTALVQLLIESNQLLILAQFIEKINRLDILSLALHLTTELGQIDGPILISLFKKIGPDDLENVCTERVTVETPVGPLQLSRLTNTWNSAAVNQVVVQHVQNTSVQDWDVEFTLTKLLLKQPMDSNSSQIWQNIFSSFAVQFGELMRDEEKMDIIFDLLSFYITITLDIHLFEKILPCVEPIVTAPKEKSRISATKFLVKISELGSRYKQIASTLILINQ